MIIVRMSNMRMSTEKSHRMLARVSVVGATPSSLRHICGIWQCTVVAALLAQTAIFLDLRTLNGAIKDN